MDGDWVPSLCGSYCRDCETGRENAQREDEMKTTKNKPAGAADTTVKQQGIFWGDPAIWREMLGKPLADKFFASAGDVQPLDHIRHIVGEYLYLESMGA